MNFFITNLKTPFGIMAALANDHALVWLSFEDSARSSEQQIKFLRQQNATVTTQTSPVLSQLATELSQYFNNQRTHFSIPLKPLGTPFQQTVWQALLAIPHGETRSYATLAASIGKPTAYRAVALANAANPISLIIPCHRVINHNGELGGYSGGVEKKSALLQHELSLAIAKTL